MDLVRRFENLGFHQEPLSTSVRHIQASSSRFQDGPVFEVLQEISRFQIDANLEYSRSAETPVLIPDQDRRHVVGRDLNTPSSILIEDHVLYHRLKQEYFMRCLKEVNILELFNQGFVDRPNFICIQSRVSEPMMSPYCKKTEWRIFAVKVHRIIFLWNEKKLSGDHGVHPAYGAIFSHLMTNTSNSTGTSDDTPNENIQNFVVQSIKFGTHKLICMSRIDCVDADLTPVEIKLSKNDLRGFLSPLKCWAHSTVQGIQKFIIGTHDEGKVTAVKVKSATEIEMKNEARICRLFEDKLLTWIQAQFRENDKNIVKAFTKAAYAEEVVVEDAPVSKLTFDIDF